MDEKKFLMVLAVTLFVCLSVPRLLGAEPKRPGRSSPNLRQVMHRCGGTTLAPIRGGWVARAVLHVPRAEPLQKISIHATGQTGGDRDPAFRISTGATWDCVLLWQAAASGERRVRHEAKTFFDVAPPVSGSGAYR